MTALDTNIIVRFVVRDDARQAQTVYSRFKQAEASRETLFVPLVVLLETIWVLENAYGLSRGEILNAIEALRGMPILRFEADAVVQRFLDSGKQTSGDLSDLLIAQSAEAAGCREIITFDKGAARMGRFRLLK